MQIDREQAAQDIFRAAVMLVGADDFRWLSSDTINRIKAHAMKLDANQAYLTTFQAVYGKTIEAEWALAQAEYWLRMNGFTIPTSQETE